MFLNTFFNILGVIGIVAVSAFVVILLCDLFISVIGGTNGIFFKFNRENRQSNNNDDSRPKLLKENTEQAYIDERVIDKKIEQAKNEVREEINEVASQLEDSKPKENEKVIIVNQEENMVDVIDEVTRLTKENLAMQENAKELESEKSALAKQLESEKEANEKYQQSLQEQIAELKNQIAIYQETIKQLENAPREETQKVLVVGSKEEIEARLEVLRQRLKDNEKELAVNKKEFIPLRRVNNTLENDKKKLRRREAIVAKQKVVLYGVNNYVDIDEEKAKKLSEEIDLLEGLRLSVQHCEEVMQKNKDRYPILERANKFLVANRDALKEDIEKLESQLAGMQDNDEE